MSKILLNEQERHCIKGAMNEMIARNTNADGVVSALATPYKTVLSTLETQEDYVDLSGGYYLCVVHALRYTNAAKTDKATCDEILQKMI